MRRQKSTITRMVGFIGRKGRTLIRGERQVSVRTSLRVSLTGLLLVILGVVLICHEFLRRDDVHRQAHEQTAVMNEMMAVQFAAFEDFKSQEKLAKTLLDMPTLLAIGVWDGDGKKLLLDGRDVKSLSLLNAAHTGNCQYSDKHYWLLHELKSESGPLDVRFGPIGVGTAGKRPSVVGTVFDIRPMLASGYANHLVMFYVPVLMSGLVTLMFGCWWLQRELVRPISNLVESAENGDRREAALTPFRHRELGRLAELLDSLHLNVSTWRNKAVMTERRVDSRIAEETKRITHDLLRLKAEVWRDPLTGVYNRRFLNEKLPEIYFAQSKTRRDLSIAMFDLDYFKVLNDTEGHAAGDSVLRFLGELMQQMTRDQDFSIRYGGDEFLLVMPGLTASQAVAVSERILAHFVQRTKVMVQVRPSPTLSVGVASIVNNNPESLNDLIEMADEVLLKAKQTGKGRVTLSKRTGETSAGHVRLARPA